MNFAIGSTGVIIWFFIFLVAVSIVLHGVYMKSFTAFTHRMAINVFFSLVLTGVTLYYWWIAAIILGVVGFGLGISKQSAAIIIGTVIAVALIVAGGLFMHHKDYMQSSYTDEEIINYSDMNAIKNVDQTLIDKILSYDGIYDVNAWNGDYIFVHYINISCVCGFNLKNKVIDTIFDYSEKKGSDTNLIYSFPKSDPGWMYYYLSNDPNQIFGINLLTGESEEKDEMDSKDNYNDIEQQFRSKDGTVFKFEVGIDDPEDYPNLKITLTNTSDNKQYDFSIFPEDTVKNVKKSKETGEGGKSEEDKDSDEFEEDDSKQSSIDDTVANSIMDSFKKSIPTSDYPRLTLEDVLERYLADIEWDYSVKGKNVIAECSGTETTAELKERKVVLRVTVDPTDPENGSTEILYDGKKQSVKEYSEFLHRAIDLYAGAVKPGEEDDISDGTDYDDSSGFLLPNSDTERITEEDLYGMSAQELTYARNELYARHGYVFESQELNDYFSSCYWYVPDYEFDGKLSKLEQKNANTIKRYQKDNELDYKPD